MSMPGDGSARRILDGVQRLDPELTTDQLGHWCGVDASLVSHWRSGARTMSVWALRRIIRNQGDARGALADLASVGGCVVVRLPDGLPEVRDVLLSFVDVQVALGELAQAVVQVTAASSSGSSRLSPGDRLYLRERIAPLLGLLTTLDCSLAEDRCG